MRHVPGTPLSSCSPRSEKARPEPTTRSVTVLETSPGWALAAGNTRADVHRQPAEVVADRLALARVHSGSRLEAELLDRTQEVLRAADRARRPGKAGERAVAR